MTSLSRQKKAQDEVDTDFSKVKINLQFMSKQYTDKRPVVKSKTQTCIVQEFDSSTSKFQGICCVILWCQ